MNRSIVTLALLACMAFAIALSGCQTQQPQRTTRADLLRNVDRAQLVVNVALSFAEVRGADAAVLATAREHSMLTFDLLRDVADRPEDLPAAVAQLRNVANDIFALCEGVGVDPVRLAGIRETVDRALGVLEARYDTNNDI